jgi:hypothetical protein
LEKLPDQLQDHLRLVFVGAAPASAPPAIARRYTARRREGLGGKLAFSERTAETAEMIGLHQRFAEARHAVE